MSQNRNENILKQALQKIQRDERAKVRTTRKNISHPRLSAPARHTSPEPRTPTNLVSFNFETNLEAKSSEIVNSDDLPEEPNVSLEESQYLSSVTFEPGQTSNSSPRTTTPTEYLFSRPKELNFENPITEYLSEKWDQQSQSVNERLDQLFNSEHSSPEDSGSPPHLEISTGQFLLTLGESQSKTSSETSEVEDIKTLLADELRKTFQPEDIQLRNTMAKQRPLNLVYTTSISRSCVHRPGPTHRTI